MKMSSQPILLTALLREEATLGQPGNVTRVAVQQERQGEPMDDVIVDSDAAGARNRLSLQVKRSVTISKGNDDFKQIIAGALATRAKTEFRPGLDRYGFIARAVPAYSRFQSLQRIIDRAKASPTGLEFANRFKPAGEKQPRKMSLCAMSCLRSSQPQPTLTPRPTFIAISLQHCT